MDIQSPDTRLQHRWCFYVSICGPKISRHVVLQKLVHACWSMLNHCLPTWNFWLPIDSFGGQNINKIIAQTWLYTVAHTSIETVDHKFLIPGHSYLENDADFSHIERKKTEFIFVPQDWIQLVGKARSKFHVTEMLTDDFVLIEPVAQLLINRKVDTEKHKISWLKMRCMQYRKSDPKAFFFKETLNKDMDFRKVNLARPCRTCSIPKHLPLLRNSPVALKKTKNWWLDVPLTVHSSSTSWVL